MLFGISDKLSTIYHVLVDIATSTLSAPLVSLCVCVCYTSLGSILIEFIGRNKITTTTTILYIYIYIITTNQVCRRYSLVANISFDIK